MGMSTDALLFYGVPLDGEGVDVDRVKVYEALGVTPPDEETFDPFEELVGDPPKGCEWVITCSYDYPTTYLAASATLHQTHRGGDKLLGEWPEVSDREKSYIDAIAVATGQKAGYYLASLLG